MDTAQQLPLSITLDDDATLDNFLSWPGASPALESLRAVIESGGDGVYVWGPRGVGKSHLMQACCAHRDGYYLPVPDLMSFPATAVLEGAGEAPLCALDDVQAVSADPQWQEALFDLFNQRKDRGLPFIVAADQPPAGLTAMLPDLKSRLASLPVFQLPKPDDTDLAAILRFRAQLRGLALSDDVCNHIVRRAERSLSTLMPLLDRLDAAALAEGRAITIPLIRDLRLLSSDR